MSFLNDALLTTSQYLPAAAGTNYTPAIDLEVDGNYSDAWRLGYFAVTVPAMPNHTDSTKNITLTMQSSKVTASTTFADQPITVSIPGVASTGSLATTFNFPLVPPNVANTCGVIGPVRFKQVVPAGDGDNTGVSITYAWQQA